MATSTELLRAAEHMRHQGALMLEDERWHVGTSYCEAADMLEREAKRLQAVEAQAESESRCKRCGQLPHDPGYCSYHDDNGTADMAEVGRSWPEGWPPFAVLRRAYAVTGASPRPSVRRMSRLAPVAASSFRRSWEKALEMVSSATSTP